MNNRLFLLLALLTSMCMVTFNLLWCASPNSGGTETGDARVVGVLYNPDGSLAAHAKVKVARWNSSPQEGEVIVDMAVTDNSGTYRFDSLPSDTFNILGSGDSGLSYLDSIVVNSNDAHTSLPPDTLKAAGSIRGSIKLEPGDDPRTVLILFMGTSTWAMPGDSSGSFTVANLAEGSYRVRFLTTLDNYLPKDTTIAIEAGAENLIPNPIRLVYTGLPAPSGLSVEYDTLHGCAVLTWKPVTVSNLAGYVIYRNDTSLTTPVRLNDKLATDTVYRDTVFSELMDTTNRVFTYRLKVQDKEANLSNMYSKSFTVSTPSPTKVRTFITWQLLNTLGDSASINDTVSFIASYTNATRNNIRVQWFIDDRDSLERSSTDSALSGRDTVQLVWSAPAQYTIFSAITDNANTVWWDSTRVSIVRDAPAANAGRDTTTSINASLAFTGTAAQKFGTIVMYKWDFDGDSIYDDSSATSATMTHTYTHEAVYAAVFYVRDDDGNEATDSLKVTVTNRPPQIASIRPDTTISIRDSILFSATATDIDGTVKEYAWDFTGDGTFEFTNTTQATAGFRYNTAGIYKAVLRVTDDDKKTTKDTAVVTVLQDVPIANAGKDTTVYIYDTIRLHGSATQRFGEFVKLEWKFGSGNWNATSGPDTFLMALAVESPVICSLAVTDDDGNRGVDDIRIFVFNEVISIAAGAYFSLVLTADGSVWTCGRNTYGQLGDGTTTDQLTPVQVMTDVKSIAAADLQNGHAAFSMMLKTDGTLWVCGNNLYGQFGDGTTNNRSIPIQVMTDVKSMAGGEEYSLIIKNDGTLFSCGNNTFGQLGDGTTTDRLTPVQVMTDVKGVAAGDGHSLILKTDGTLWSCGYNFYGQLGDGTTTHRSTPVQVMSDVQSMAGGGGYSLILKTDNTLWGCGTNCYGQLGDGTTTDQSTPILVMNNVKSIAAGDRHTLILKTDGTVWTCGFNFYGQLGDGTINDQSSPVQVMTNVKSIAGGKYHSLFLKTDGTLWACGNSQFGQLGDGKTATRRTPVRVIPLQ